MNKKILCAWCIMGIITLLLIIYFVIINIKDEEIVLSGTYYLVTQNIINDEEYSKVTEMLEINEDSYNYVKEVKYTDEKLEDISDDRSGTLKIEDNKLVIEDKTYYVKNDKICLDKKCSKYFSKKEKEFSNNINEFDPKDYLIKVDNIDETKELSDIVFIVVAQKGCYHCEAYEKILKEVVKDYDINFYILEVNKLSKDEKNRIKKEFGITGTPSTILYKDGEVLEIHKGKIEKDNLEHILFNLNIKSR